MRTIPNLHDFISLLPASIQDEIRQLSTVRSLHKGEILYCKGDASLEMYRLVDGAVNLCNYSYNGREIVVSELLPGDCFGEVGLVDGMPRGTHAVASRDSRVSVLSLSHFERLWDSHPEFGRQLSMMLCRKLRLAFTLNEDNVGLRLRDRLARLIHRLAYSHGSSDGGGGTYIEISHDALAKMLGASRQTIGIELKSLEDEGSISRGYGKIHVLDLKAFGYKYETAAGIEQVTPLYLKKDK